MIPPGEGLERPRLGPRPRTRRGREGGGARPVPVSGFLRRESENGTVVGGSAERAEPECEYHTQVGRAVAPRERGGARVRPDRSHRRSAPGPSQRLRARRVGVPGRETPAPEGGGSSPGLGGCYREGGNSVVTPVGSVS